MKPISEERRGRARQGSSTKNLRSNRWKVTNKRGNFLAEAAYAESMFRTAFGDVKGALSALRLALEFAPTYAPAILSMGSVEYQRGRTVEGRRLFDSLLSLPESTPDLCEIIDEAGSFLIQIRAYSDGLALYQAAMARFPAVAGFHQGIGCCAGHEGMHDQAVAASERALQLAPGRQELVNDLGWALYEAGRLEEAERVLELAVSMDPSDGLAPENLRICRTQISAKRNERKATPNNRLRRVRAGARPRCSVASKRPSGAGKSDATEV